MIRSSLSLLKWLFRLLVVFYFLVALGVIAIRYVVLPSINTWKEPLAQMASSALNTTVRFGHIHASLTTFNPRFEIRDLEIQDPNGHRVVLLPQVQAQLSWRTFLTGRPEFVSLVIRDSHFDVRMEPSGRLWALGQALDPQDTEPVQPGSQARLIHWLLAQQYVQVSNATIRWYDESQPTLEPLDLQQVSLYWRAAGQDRWFSMSAVPPASLGQRVDIALELSDIQHTPSGSLTMAGSHGSAFLNIPGMRPSAWSPWLSLPSQLDVDNFTVSAWVPLIDGVPQSLVTRWAVGNTNVSLTGSDSLHVAQAQALVVAGWPWLQHHWATDTAAPSADTAWLAESEAGNAVKDNASNHLPSFTGPEIKAGVAPKPYDLSNDVVPDGVQYWVQAERLQSVLPSVFPEPISLDSLQFQGVLASDTRSNMRVDITRLRLHNKDILADLSGTWHPGGDGTEGMIDLRGFIPYADVDAIDRYLPYEVNQEARDWMAHSLKAGTLRDTELILKGDLFHFPFQQAPEQGDFQIKGMIDNATIDYLPAEHHTPGWPALQGIQGAIELRRARLSIEADTAYMMPDAEHRLHLATIKADIADLENNSVLTLQGDTQGSAQAYRALTMTSPLGDLLERLLDEAQLTGQWSVPLALSIPLDHADDTKVSGAIQMTDSMVQLMPELPAVTDLHGTLEFSDQALVARDLKGRMLGGPVSLTGGIGTGYKGLIVRGLADAPALARYANLKGMQYVRGTVPYRLRIDRDRARQLVLEATSDLKSTILDLPAPLSKKAGVIAPLHVLWRSRDATSRRLTIKWADHITADFLRLDKATRDSWFVAGAVAVGKKAELPASGIVLDVATPHVDIDAWRRVIDDFSQPLEPLTSPSLAVFPEVRRLRIQADTAQLFDSVFDRFTITAQRPQDQQWRVDVVSSEAAGTLFWRESAPGIPGRVDAKFDRLAIGQASNGTAHAMVKSSQTPVETSSAYEAVDIPGVNLYVKNLRLYGYDLGELSVMGLNQERGLSWRLDELTLNNPTMALTGSGVWQLTGVERGLRLSAQADVLDLGAFLGRVGHQDVMSGGSGSITADIMWRNMPWSFDRVDLDGQLQFDLKNGRFVSVNSYTARLLGLLSLQSLSRLARLEFNPAQVAESGFPYDNLGGSVQLEQGVLKTSDYRITGPIATIVIEGTVNLMTELLNLKAVVIPNLDVSGAAVAAGIAINPIVGIGAFLTQWLLQSPLSKAMSLQYNVEGTWSEPKLQEVSVQEKDEKKR